MRNAFRLLPLLLLALGAALVAGCQDDDERVSDIIQRFLLAGRGDVPTKVERFVGELPEGLPVEPPLYPDAEILTSTRLRPGAGATDQSTGEALQGAVYFILLDTPDDREDVYRFYEEALEEDPWQLEQTASSEEVDRLDFSSVADIDITGSVTLVQGEEDEETSILIFLQDAGATSAEDEEFAEGTTAILPASFPPEIPIYDEAIVLGTGSLREPGRESFLLQFITLDSEDEVVDFYRETFEDEGWTVEEGDPAAGEGALRFESEDGSVEGDIEVQEFLQDDQYLLVRITVSATPSGEDEDTDSDQPTEEEQPTDEPTADDVEPTPVRTVPENVPPTG
jgi:hypothetical protein